MSAGPTVIGRIVTATPLGLLVILDLASVSISDSIRVIIWLEALSLTFWAGLAAFKAGAGPLGAGQVADRTAGLPLPDSTPPVSAIGHRAATTGTPNSGTRYRHHCGLCA